MDMRFLYALQCAHKNHPQILVVLSDSNHSEAFGAVHVNEYREVASNQLLSQARVCMVRTVPAHHLEWAKHASS